MKRSVPTATSLPSAPRDEDMIRVRSYIITMVIRTVCLVLAVLVVPYGWHTLLFGLGAVFLPYIAVVYANARGNAPSDTAQGPVRALSDVPQHHSASTPTILKVSESQPQEPRSDKPDAP